MHKHSEVSIYLHTSRNSLKKLRTLKLQIISFLTFLQNRDTPLHLSSKEGHSEIAEILIKSGASTSVVNKVSCVSVIISKRIAS